MYRLFYRKHQKKASILPYHSIKYYAILHITPYCTIEEITMYTKRKKIVTICLILVLFFVLGSCIPRNFTIHKTLSCFDAETNTPFEVHISGIYHQFFWKDDNFDGNITLDGKEISSGTLLFQNDFSATILDASGNPKWLISQFKQFSYISIVDNTRNIRSTWEPIWQTEFEQQENFQKFLDTILPNT